jgi:protein-tyrosine phosphatase
VKKVLFVCTANVCRSPMAEAIFNALAEDRGLGYQAESAGTAALRNEPMAPNASATLEEIGIYTEGHQARQVSEEMLEKADLVLAMAPWHVARLNQVFGASFKVHTLPGYVGGASGEEDISDPYGSTMVAYRASARQILEYIDLLVARLQG